MMLGGLSETQPATPEIQKIVDKVKPQFEEKTKEKYDGFKAVTYRSQVVSGFMYYVKVDLGCERYAHLKIVDPLPHTSDPIELLNYQTGKTNADEITPF